MGRGRPTKLTPEVQKALCNAIAGTKISIADAASAAGIDKATVFVWIARGKKESSGIYFDFHNAIEQARAQGTQMLLARISSAATAPKHWQAAAHLLSMTEPGYSPRVRVQVEGELKTIYEQLKTAFASEPETLERIIRVIAGENQTPTEELESGE